MRRPRYGSLLLLSLVSTVIAATGAPVDVGNTGSDDGGGLSAVMSSLTQGSGEEPEPGSGEETEPGSGEGVDTTTASSGGGRTITKTTTSIIASVTSTTLVPPSGTSINGTTRESGPLESSNGASDGTIYFTLGTWEVTIWWLVLIIVVLIIAVVLLIVLTCYCRNRRRNGTSSKSSYSIEDNGQEAFFNNPVFEGARPDMNRSPRALSLYRQNRMDGDVEC